MFRPDVRHLAVISVVAALMLFLRLGAAQLWDRDEPRNAGCAAEMLAANDWVVPVFNGELRDHKPIMLYWLTMASYSLLGVNEFAARFASALLSVGTVLLTYGIGRILFDSSSAVWGALVLATSLLFCLVGRAATPDATLVFCCTLAMYLFVRSAVITPGHATTPTSWRDPFPLSDAAAWAIYGAMGLAALTKGPVGLVLPTAAIGMFCLIARLPASSPASAPNWWHRAISLVRPFAPRHFLQTCWAMRPITAIVVVLIVAGPWYAWVGWRTDGAWLQGFFGTHNFGRAVAAMEGHEGSLLFYPLTLLVGFFPWSVLTIPTVIDSKAALQQQPTRLAHTFLVCWAAVYVVAFSCAQTKLPNYILPAYPAVALLLGVFVARCRVPSVGWERQWVNVGRITLGCVGVVMTLALWLLLPEHLPAERWLAAIGLIPLVGACVSCERIDQQKSRLPAVLLATAALLCFALLSIAAPRVSHHQRIQELLSGVDDRVNQPELAAIGRLEPSWVYYWGKTIQNFASDERGIEAAAAFASERPSRVVLTAASNLSALEEINDGEIVILDRVPIFLDEEELLAIQIKANPTRVVDARQTGGGR